MSDVIEAILIGDLSRLSEALQAGESANVSDGMTTALSLACLQDRVDLVSALLANGADVNCLDGDGSTPLFTALRVGSDAIVEMLLEAGASTKTRNEIRQDPLMIAAHSGNLRSVRLLLSHGANPSAVDDHGRTALHWAVVGGDRPGVIELLLKTGLSAEARSLDGKSAIDYATEMDRAESLTLLRGT